MALCRAAARDEEDAALALSRWGAFEAASEQSERRFRRRAFERARDRALIGLAMTRSDCVTVAARRVSRRSRSRSRRAVAA